MRRELRLSAPIPVELLEEVREKLPYCSEDAADFEIDPLRRESITFQVRAPADPAKVEAKVLKMVSGMVKGWRPLPQKVLFSQRYIEPAYQRDIWQALIERGWIRAVAPGQVCLGGPVLSLFEFFDRTFREMGRELGGTEVRYPQMISLPILNRCQYFSSFPHHVTFASHLRGDVDVISAFSRTQERGESFPFESGMHAPEYVIAPAVCFHSYHSLADAPLVEPVVLTMASRCFRFEASAMTSLERLWDFTMREIVFVGPADWVKSRRQLTIERVSAFITSLGLNAWIETANDPFFVTSFIAKKYHQLMTEAKYELRLAIPYVGHSLAAASFNYHEDFFGRSFKIALGDHYAHTGCTAFGLERWVFAVLSQFGPEPKEWPRALSPDTIAGAHLRERVHA